MAYVPIELLKCVAFLGYINPQGQEKLAGSAFWVTRPGPEDIKNDYRPTYLVTAAHVLDEIKKHSNRVGVRVNTTGGSPEWDNTPLQSWRTHPNPHVDLAVLKIGIKETYDHAAWPLEVIVKDGNMDDDDRKVELGDELFFSGLFWPHKGEKRNIPIVRIGNVAALREEPVLEMDIYLVESRSMGGLSGSPVFIDVKKAKRERPPAFGGYMQAAYGDSVHGSPSRFRLFGVVRGHFTGHEVEPDAAAAQEKVNMGVAMVIPAEKILEVLSQYMKEEELEAEEIRERKRSIIVADSVPQTNTTYK